VKVMILLASVFTFGVLAGLSLAVFLSTAAERRWFSCLWGRLRVFWRAPKASAPMSLEEHTPKAPAPMSLEEAWAAQGRLQGFTSRRYDSLARQLHSIGPPQDPNDFMRPANAPDWE
jgi:hypothetical protein